MSLQNGHNQLPPQTEAPRWRRSGRACRRHPLLRTRRRRSSSPPPESPPEAHVPVFAYLCTFNIYKKRTISIKSNTGNNRHSRPHSGGSTVKKIASIRKTLIKYQEQTPAIVFLMLHPCMVSRISSCNSSNVISSYRNNSGMLTLVCRYGGWAPKSNSIFKLKPRHR